MHGSRVFLPNKLRYFTEMACELKADIIAFAYRGFSYSDGSNPNEHGIKIDIETITKFFEQFVKNQGGS